MKDDNDDDSRPVKDVEAKTMRHLVWYALKMILIAAAVIFALVYLILDDGLYKMIDTIKDISNHTIEGKSNYIISNQ